MLVTNPEIQNGFFSDDVQNGETLPAMLVSSTELRKFCEQISDIRQWDPSNKNYILTHGVSGVDWRFYKSPLPANVFDTYMQYREDFGLTSV